MSLTTVALYGRTLVSVCARFLPILAIDTFCRFSILITLQNPPPGDKTILEVKSRGNKHKYISGEVQEKKETDKKGGELITRQGKRREVLNEEESLNHHCHHSGCAHIQLCPFHYRDDSEWTGVTSNTEVSGYCCVYGCCTPAAHICSRCFICRDWESCQV